MSLATRQQRRLSSYAPSRTPKTFRQTLLCKELDAKYQIRNYPCPTFAYHAIPCRALTPATPALSSENDFDASIHSG